MAEGLPELTKVQINGIDVSDYIFSWKLKDTSGSDFIRNCMFVINKAVQAVIDTDDETLIGTTVIIQRGITVATEQTIFKGILTKINRFGGALEIDAKDMLYTTTKRTITYSYDKDIDISAGVISEIVIDMITNYTDLTADATSVQNSGTVNILSKYVCKAESVYFKFSELANTIGWIFYYNPSTNKVYFEPKGQTTQTTIIKLGTNIGKIPKWVTDETNIYNVVRVEGAVQDTRTTETGQIGVTTGYSTTYIQLNYTPKTTRVLCDTANPPTTERVFGVRNSTTIYDYYVDVEKKRIVWNSTYTPSDNDYVIVEYNYDRPVPILADDEDSKTQYGTKEITLRKEEYKEVTDAEVFARDYLADHKDPIISTDLEVTNISDLAIGQQVRVIDSYNNIDSYFYIDSLELNYPYRKDKLKVVNNIIGSYNYTLDLSKRLSALEKRNQEDYDTLTTIKSFSNTAIVEDRNLRIDKKDWAGVATPPRAYGDKNTWGKYEGTSPTGTTKDGFEDGDYTTDPTWTVYVGNAAKATVQNTIKYEGTYALKIITDATDTYTGLSTPLTLNSDRVYECWIYSSPIDSYCYFQLYKANNDELRMLSDGVYIYTYYNDGNVHYSAVTDPDTWYRAQITLPASSPGNVVFKLFTTAGTEIYSRTVEVTSPSGFAYDTVRLNAYRGTPGTKNSYFDLVTYGFASGDPKGRPYGAGSGSTTTVQVLANPFNKYTELFYDDDFKDTTTTADWNTTNQNCEIENVEFALSEEFARDINANNNAYTKVRLSITGTNLDNLTYKIGEDNSSSITYTTIPTTGGTTVRYSNWVNLVGTNKYGINWKVENSSGSTGTITKLVIEYGMS